MIPITFTQLLAKALFNIPLPLNNEGGFCRECGGPIEKGCGRKVVMSDKEIGTSGKKYQDSWVDEGIIPFNVSTMVCEHCFRVGKGSTTRTTTIPPMGKVLLVTPERSYPTAEILSKVWPATDGNEDSKGIKKDFLYSNGLSIIDFLQMLPDIPIPFGIILGNGGKNDKHYFRSIPLNWSIGDSIIGIIMSDFKFVSFRWQELKTACEDGRVQEVFNLPKGKRGEAFIKVSQEHGLTGAESKLFTYTMLGLSND